MRRQILLVEIGSGLAIVGETSNGEVGLPWIATFKAIGGLGDYSWSISEGAEPPGAALDSVTDSASIEAAALTLAGYFTFTLKLTDNVQRLSVYRTFNVQVRPLYGVLEYLLTEAGDRLTTEGGAPLRLEA